MKSVARPCKGRLGEARLWEVSFPMASRQTAAGRGSAFAHVSGVRRPERGSCVNRWDGDDDAVCAASCRFRCLRRDGCAVVRRNARPIARNRYLCRSDRSPAICDGWHGAAEKGGDGLGLPVRPAGHIVQWLCSQRAATAIVHLLLRTSAMQMYSSPCVSDRTPNPSCCTDSRALSFGKPKSKGSPHRAY